jgi:hypothetical protein
VDRTGSGSCPVADFDISGLDILGCVTRNFVQFVSYSNKHSRHLIFSLRLGLKCSTAWVHTIVELP